MIQRQLGSRGLIDGVVINLPGIRRTFGDQLVIGCVVSSNAMLIGLRNTGIRKEISSFRSQLFL